MKKELINLVRLQDFPLKVNGKKNCGVYGFRLDSKSRFIYIGATSDNIENRIKQHFSNYKLGKINENLKQLFDFCLQNNYNFSVEFLSGNPSDEKAFCELYKVSLNQLFYK